MTAGVQLQPTLILNPRVMPAFCPWILRDHVLYRDLVGPILPARRSLLLLFFFFSFSNVKSSEISAVVIVFPYYWIIFKENRNMSIIFLFTKIIY